MCTRGVTYAHAHEASHIGHIFLRFTQITYCGAGQRKLEQMQWEKSTGKRLTTNIYISKDLVTNITILH